MVSGRKHTNYFPIMETEAYKGYEKSSRRSLHLPGCRLKNI